MLDRKANSRGKKGPPPLEGPLRRMKRKKIDWPPGIVLEGRGPPSSISEEKGKKFWIRIGKRERGAY